MNRARATARAAGDGRPARGCCGLGSRAAGAAVWVALALLAAGLPGCGGAQRQLPPSALQASGTELPDWLRGVPAGRCPAGQVCLVGAASGLTGPRPKAERAARMDAYLRLAEQAFPVQVSQQYRSQRVDDDVQVAERTETEVLGRLRGARVLEQFWLLRRLHSLDGYLDVNDAWALVAIERTQLDGLYPAELQRAAEESTRLGQELALANQGLGLDGEAATGAEQVGRAVGCVRQVGARLPQLQDVPQKQTLQADLTQLAARLERTLALTLTQVTPDPASGELQVVLRLAARTANGTVPLVGLELEAELPARTTALRRTARTDAEGLARLSLPVGAPFTPTTLVARPGGAPGLERRLELPAPFSCLRPEFELRVRGPQGGELESGLLARQVELRQLIEAWGPACPEQAWSDPVGAGGQVELRLQLVAEVNPARRLGGRVLMAGGQARTEVVARGAGRQLFRWASGSQPVKGIGLDHDQVRRNVEEMLVLQAKEAVKRAASWGAATN